ncbi:MAG TPA: phosphate ABC transporter permease subunit PstC [Solirubrobacteraceae bacterium]|nr:phosphate ABC transporter permease subunit PstC [Solirubrobacteraceae bacterium]
MQARTPVIAGGRSDLERSPAAKLPDQILKWGLLGVSLAVLALIVFFFIKLIGQSTDAFNRFGILGFAFHNRWLPSRLIFGAAAMLFGTAVTSAIALIIGVPVAVATALYLTELCPRRARTPLTILVDLLAAVPSVVYGLWGYLFLIPKLKPAEQWFANTFSFIPYVSGHVAGPSIFIAGLILAIMILPIVSAIAREVISTAPPENKEAALALGATRWEMIRMAVLPYARPGITGGAMLGLGRALGETIAVLLVIGDDPAIPKFIFGQGYSLAAVIANEFGEGSNTPIYRSALLACGLVLFVLTLFVNGFARAYVTRGERRMFRGGRRDGGGEESEVETAMAT